MRSAVSLRAATAAYRRGYGNKAGNGTGNGPKYRQGQSPAPRRREYFYWVDTHGRFVTTGVTPLSDTVTW
uniref:Uncharacterized protein n=1 Tax=Meleagris gallopavo TaxID=9103 RepID=A0A803Y826_MELGA